MLKVAVVSHPARLDTWFLDSQPRVSRMSHAEVDDCLRLPRSTGRGKKIMSFPDAPPLLGVITPTGVFTEKTRQVALPFWHRALAMSSTFGARRSVGWWTQREASQPCVDNHQHYVKSTTGHFKKGATSRCSARWLPTSSSCCAV